MYVDNKASSHHPVVLTAHLDPGLSRWQWLVKWFLAIPHYFLLAFLWPAFVIETSVDSATSARVYNLPLDASQAR